MNIKAIVQRLAKERKLTIAEIERNTGIANGTIGKWDKQNPSVETLQKLSDYFNVSADYLLGRTDNPKVNNGDSEDDKDLLIAAHIRDGLSDEEKEEVMQYIEFLKSKHSN